MMAATSSARRPIVASRHLDAPPDEVLRFLNRLENHPRLAPESIEMRYLHRNPDGDTQALVRLRGPVGIRRTARTDLCPTPAGSERVTGRATIGERTEASVTWLVEAAKSGSIVTVVVSVLAADLRDGFLLHLGARRWLAGQLRAALGRLSDDLVATAPAMGDRPERLQVAMRTPST